MAIPPSLQSLPDCLKTLKHYLKIAEDHDKKNKPISYYCRFYVMHKAISSQMTPESRIYLRQLMDYMEQFKKENQEDSIHNEIVGQATVEDYALKMFLYADNEDRAGRFHKAMIKSFFTAGLLFDVLTVFGELSDQIEANKKYAKWKATYIHKCLQTGETPISGPTGSPDIEPTDAPVHSDAGQPMGNQPSGVGTVAPPCTPSVQTYIPPPEAPPRSTIPAAPCPSPQQPFVGEWQQQPDPPTGGVQLSTKDFSSAIKSCNFAVSALQYEDTPTAINYLQKALKLLTTGTE